MTAGETETWRLRPSGPASTRLPQLDSIRGFAALAIVVFHFCEILLPALNSSLTAKFYFAVDVFFVLSGFVMIHIYGATFAAGVAPRDVLSFLWARLARIYPLHLVALLALVLLGVAQGLRRGGVPGDLGLAVHSFLYNVLLLHGPWLDRVSWNAPSWSISVEWHFYLVFPIAAFLLARASAKAPIIILAGAAAALGALAVHVPTFNIINGPLVLWRAAPEFAIGMATAVLYRCGALPGRLLDSPISRMLAWRPLVHLGEISYSVYLLHGVMWIYIASALHATTGQRAFVGLGIAPSAAILASLVVAVFCISEASYRWIECPARRWMRDAGAPWLTRAGTSSERRRV